MRRYFTTLISIEQVEKLSTPRLVTYYKKNGRQWNNLEYDEIEEIYTVSEKEFNERKNYWEKVKEILNTREHVEPKKKKK